MGLGVVVLRWLVFGVFGVLGFGGGWCVSFWVGEHPFGRISESRDAF